MRNIFSSTIILRTFRFVYKLEKKYFRLAILNALISGLTPIVSLYLLENIINTVQVGSYSSKTMLIMIMSLIGIQATSNIFSIVFSYKHFSTNLRISNYIELSILSKSEKLQLKDFEDSNTYNIITRARNQNGSSFLEFMNLSTQIVQGSVTIVSSFLLLSRYRIIPFIALLFLPTISYFISIKLNKIQYQNYIRRTDKERRRWYINHLALMGESIKELKISRRFSELKKEYKRYQDEFFKQDTRILKMKTISEIVIIVLFHGLLMFIYLTLVRDALMGILLIGSLAAYFSAIQQLTDSYSASLDSLNAILNTSQYIKDYYDFMDLEDSEYKHKRKVKVQNIERIDFKNVSFTYPDGVTALENVNLSFSKGDRIGLVGKNGSGKSTLVKLLLGFYDNYSGEICINDTNIKEIDINSIWRLSVSLFQDYLKYEGTIDENIRFSSKDQPFESKTAYELLEALNFPKRFVGKYDSEPVGMWFGSTQLSEGQWQKLAICRALYKKKDLLILDEPDASLDGNTKQRLISLVKENNPLGVSFLVSHEIEHIKQFSNKIAFLKKGEVISFGTHDQLYDSVKEYREMYDNKTYIS